MNILFIFIAPNIPYQGGVQRVSDTLARELVRRGHIVTFLACGYKELMDSPDIAYPQRYVDLSGRTDAEVAADLNTIVSERKITNVVSQVCDGRSNRIVRLLPDFLHNRVVYCCHVIPFCYMGYTRREIRGLLAENYRQRLFKAASLMCPRIYKTFLSRIEKNNLREGFSLAVKFCFISDKYFKNVLENMPDAPSEKFIYINNPNTYPSQTHLPEYGNREKSIVWVGRVENSQKNIMGFLRMWKMFSAQCPDWKAYIIGDGRDLSAAKSYVRDNNLSNVSFEGSKSDVMPYYKKSRFLVVTSFWESWGMIITEAMTCGCIPAVMDTFPTLADIVDDKVNGLVCPNDEKAMAVILSETVNKVAQCEKMSLAATDKVRKFDAAVIVDQWEALLGSL